MLEVPARPAKQSRSHTGPCWNATPLASFDAPGLRRPHAGHHDGRRATARRSPEPPKKAPHSTSAALRSTHSVEQDSGRTLGQPEHLAGPSQKHTAAPRALACPWSPADDFCTKRPHTPVAPRCATHARWRGCLSGQPNDARDVAIQRRLEPSGRCSTGRGIFATHRTRPGGACMHESLLACMQAPARSGAQPGWENSPRTERGCVQRAAQQARSGRGAKLGSMTHRTLRRCRRPRRSKLSTYVHKWLVRPSAVLRGAVLGMLGSVERIGHDRAAATEPLATKGS